MKCPSCQFEQSENRLDCEVCGLVFAKWKAKQEAASAPPTTQTLAAPEKKGIGLPGFSGTKALWGNRAGLYHQIADLDFQKNPEGDWTFFPWGSFGRGCLLKDETTRNQLKYFDAAFSSVHTPLAACLGLTAFLIQTKEFDPSPLGFIPLFFYLAVAYLFFWIRVKGLTRSLPVSPHRVRQKRYYQEFFLVFNWKLFLDLEIIGLFLTLFCIWMWLTRFWLWFFSAENSPALVVFFAFSVLLTVAFTFFRYFRPK